MPSLRKRVSTYLRQLSFHNEPRDKKHHINENSFVTKYLQGQITLKEGPPCIYGKNPTDLPNYELGKYESGSDTVIGCYSGPNGGLTTVKRIEKHLSVLDADIDFIDTTDDVAEETSEISNVPAIVINDSRLPTEWNKKSDHIYGLSDSLYDRNQVTKNKNGDPIADCFGIIARNDSAILAVADGVNWGEKACIAAKSAVHGCLHYLDKTIFNDTKPFESLTVKTEDSAPNSLNADIARNENLIKNTREVFVCLLRAFNCAHDLILENKGMLTTLTVAIVLPLRQKMVLGSQEDATRYVCCVCNVGDTLAYVYSQKYGVRELTKGSHDINCNRDMRDALGALGPVDGINPELSNLTLSITTLSKGDIVMVASDGLTDNFDPNVCKFSTNAATPEPPKPKRQGQVKPPRSNPPATQMEQKPTPPDAIATPTATSPPKQQPSTPPQFAKPPVKPPRRSKNRDDISRNSAERASIKSNTLSIKSTSTVESNSVAASSNATLPLETHFDANNPLIAQFVQDNAVDDGKTNSLDAKKPVVLDNKAYSLRRQQSSQVKEQSATLGSQGRVSGGGRGEVSKKTATERGKSEGMGGAYKFLRSKTSVDFRSQPSPKHILRSCDGVPLVTPIQRYELQLLLIEDVLRNGISGKDAPCTSAKKLCENLVSFTLSITSAKRHTLEDPDLYFDNRNGVMVEVSGQEKKIRRKRGLERVQNLPGKLDHVTVVAYNVGNYGF
ncbi:unnamed protein product [Brassicogethes aeneus]|uniref:PPM-type phosphatase domain-containing protein n=1 Tax=Brassicogethes aeneus TaxID=1431903 RepID=A0A9P0FDI2_BRAAE|nr:unnamed protein product [Brassicogethes aeneus]